ncbi:unnamed protein product, partial [Owenia fusiformis]
ESVKMASLIPENGVVFDYSSQAPSPCKDFCQILITKKEVIFRLWKISPRVEGKFPPTEIRGPYEDFEYDERLQSEIHRVFGKGMVEYVHGITQGRLDYLPRLENDIALRIIRFLELEDIAHLAQVSKHFRDLCSSNELWEKIYIDSSETPVTDELRDLAEKEGWKKLFFTNKLQLQVQLRRQARKRKLSEKGEGLVPEEAFMTENTDE